MAGDRQARDGNAASPEGEGDGPGVEARAGEPGTPDRPELDLAGQLDRLIHEPARLAVVSLLAVVESADFVFLQDRTGLTGGNLGSHMARLEAAGYVEVEKGFVGRKPQTTYRLTAPGRRAFAEYRRRMAAVLEGAEGTDDRG